MVPQLHKWAIVAYIFYQVSCADCYILRVEQVRKTNISFVIPNSKLSVTVYIYITARQLFSRTTKFADRYFLNQIRLCNLNFFYVLISNLLDIIYTINVITVELINNLFRYASPRIPAKFPSKTQCHKSVYQNYTDSLPNST